MRQGPENCDRHPPSKFMPLPSPNTKDLPPTRWGKVLGTTPVVLTVVATLLAGLASSEMTSAQYDRAFAAQLQSKAGDQWGYFQAKKLRSALQRNTLEILEATTEVHPIDATAVHEALSHSSLSDRSAIGEAVVRAIEHGALPTGPHVAPSGAVKPALDALANSAPEPELIALLAPVKDQVLSEDLRSAQAAVSAFDLAVKPILQAVDGLERAFVGTPQRRDFTAARLRLQAARYDAEAELNQAVGSLFELQVRKSNGSAERHHRRSQRFFFGMLAAQAGVILSTLALAAQRRSWLWAVAAIAGAIAVAFAIYVYLFV